MTILESEATIMPKPQGKRPYPQKVPTTGARGSGKTTSNGK